MGKDETLKNIKAGKGLPPIGGKNTNGGVKKETRSSEGMKVMIFSSVGENNNTNKGR